MTDKQKSWEDYSAAELQAFRASLNVEDLPPEQKAQIPQLDAIIQKKLVQEEIDQREGQTRFRDLAKKLDAKAKKMFPELNDRESDLARKTEEYLEAMGTGTSDPNAFLNASMLAAEELGIDPAQYRRETPNPDKTSGGKGTKPEGTVVKDDAFLKRTAKLRQMLESEGVLDTSKEGVMEGILARREQLEQEEL